METAAYSLGLGCVILGSLLNNIPGLIDVLNLPEYTYPVLGLAIGKPDQNPTVKPRNAAHDAVLREHLPG